MTNGLSNHAAPNGLHADNGTSTTNGSTTTTAVNGSGDAFSQFSSQQQQQAPKEYVRVYDYLSTWSGYTGSCDNNKTLITNEMQSEDTEMAEENKCDESNSLIGCKVSNSTVEHSQSIVQAQGYDSMLCETMFEPSYGHAY